MGKKVDDRSMIAIMASLCRLRVSTGGFQVLKIEVGPGSADQKRTHRSNQPAPQQSPEYRESDATRRFTGGRSCDREEGECIYSSPIPVLAVTAILNTSD